MGLLDGRLVMVDRVASLEEARLFRHAGASMIGVALDAEVRFEDHRFVTADVARDIRGAIGPEGFVGIMPKSYEPATFYDRLERLLDLEPGWLQVHSSDANAGLGEYLRVGEDGLPVIVEGLAMDEDYGAFTPPGDPAKAIRERYGLVAPVSPSLATVDLRGDSADVWRHLSVLAPAAPDEFREDMLQAGHVQAATRELPLLLDLAGVLPRDARAFVQAFPGARGFYARLGPERGGCTSILPERLLPVLEALRG